MFNECLEIGGKTTHFCILKFSIRHLEVRQKYSAARRIFNSFLSVASHA